MSKVAIAQMSSSSNLNANLKVVEALFAKAAEAEAELLLLPENFALMANNDKEKFTIAEEYGRGPIQDTIQKLTIKYNIWSIAGTIPLRGNANKLKASSIVFDNKGETVARYDKIHLFDVRVSKDEAHQESLTIEPGEEVVVVGTPVGKIGLSVCYDLRFPELYRKLVLKGAEILSIPSAFTAVTGAAHWHALLRSRAIENLCYVIAANQCGTHDNGRKTYGHSMVIDPWGKIVAEREVGPGIITIDINLHNVHRLREQFPSNDHHILEKLALKP